LTDFHLLLIGGLGIQEKIIVLDRISFILFLFFIMEVKQNFYFF